MSSKLTGKRFVRALPVGSTVVVHETRYAGQPLFWVGVVTAHPADPDGTPYRLPVVRLVAKPRQCGLSEWWTVGKSYQTTDRQVYSLDEAREKFGDQPEFVETTMTPGWCPTSGCASHHGDMTTPVGAACPVCGTELA